MALWLYNLVDTRQDTPPPPKKKKNPKTHKINFPTVLRCTTQTKNPNVHAMRKGYFIVLSAAHSEWHITWSQSNGACIWPTMAIASWIPNFETTRLIGKFNSKFITKFIGIFIFQIFIRTGKCASFTVLWIVNKIITIDMSEGIILFENMSEISQVKIEKQSDTAIKNNAECTLNTITT